jgi:hypothetical protein
MSAASAYVASGPLPSATYAGWDSQTKQEPLWVAAGTAGGQNAAGPAGAVQFSDGAGIFQGTANATLSGAGSLALSGDAVIGSNLNVALIATVGTDLIVANDVTASGNISCGNLVLSGDATVANLLTATTVTASGAVSGASVTASGAIAGASLACAGIATIGGSASVTGNLTVGGSFAPAKLNLPYGAGMGTPGAPISLPVADPPGGFFQMVGNKAFVTQPSIGGTTTIICDPALAGTFPVVTCVGGGSGDGGGLGPVLRSYSVVGGAWRFAGTNWGAGSTYQITWV